MLEHPVVVEDLREVAAPAVGDRRQDRRLRSEALRHARASRTPRFRRSRRRGSPPRGPAAGCQERVAVGDADVLVHDGRVEALGKGVLADPLDEVRVDRAAGVDRALGVGADDQQVRLALLQIAGDAGDRAARADGDHDRVELAAGLLPDLGPGRAVVRLRVPGIRVLVGLVRAGDLLGEPVGDEVVALGRVGVDRGRADDDVGAERAQERDLLGRDLVGDDEDHPVALDRGGEREADAGVAGGRLDDRSARLQRSVALGVLDHAERDPVLVRAPGVQVLELREQRRAELAADVLEADDRRRADQVEQRWVLAGHDAPKPSGLC